MKKIIVLLWIFIMTTGGQVMAMELKSQEFKNNGYIPKKFTYRAENVNPALTIENIPAGARSIALIVDDPDAPGGTWVHWLLFDIPVISEIKEDSAPGKQGVNDFGRNGYDGPSPPSGTHRYIFKAYALDTELNLAEGVTKIVLEKAMLGHILAEAKLVGLYKKQ